MAKHPEPRWMTALWHVLVVCIIGSFVAVGLRRGYDFVQIVGLLGANFGAIFSFFLLAALAPCAVSVLLN